MLYMFRAPLGLYFWGKKIIIFIAAVIITWQVIKILLLSASEFEMTVVRELPLFSLQ